jgi:hypothetical protein
MDEKDSKVEQSSAAKTSRRDFLKGSAAIAGSEGIFCVCSNSNEI